MNACVNVRSLPTSFGISVGTPRKRHLMAYCKEKHNWLCSIGIGRIGGLSLRIHVSFFVFAAWLLFVSRSVPMNDTIMDISHYSLLGLAILLVSSLLHELAHYYAVRKYGEFQPRPDRITLAPFGGVQTPEIEGDLLDEMMAAIAGPLVNLTICGIAAIVMSFTNSIRFGELIQLTPSSGLLEGSLLLVTGKLIFWCNWLMFLINMIPAAPFDGGRISRVICTWQQPDLEDIYKGRELSRNNHLAGIIASRFARLIAAALLVAACCCWTETSYGFGALWFILTVLGIYVFFHSRLTEDAHMSMWLRERDAMLSHTHRQAPDDASETGLVIRPRPDPYGTDVYMEKHHAQIFKPSEQLLEAHRDNEQHLREQQEVEDDRRLDTILSHVHRSGLESLTPDDRDFLQRVSARYRDRNQAR